MTRSIMRPLCDSRQSYLFLPVCGFSFQAHRTYDHPDYWCYCSKVLTILAHSTARNWPKQVFKCPSWWKNFENQLTELRHLQNCEIAISQRKMMWACLKSWCFYWESELRVFTGLVRNQLVQNEKKLQVFDDHISPHPRFIFWAIRSRL